MDLFKKHIKDDFNKHKIENKVEQTKFPDNFSDRLDFSKKM